MMQKDNYIIYTSDERYFVEYLLKQLILSKSITEAMTFDTLQTAQGFKRILENECNLICSINTYLF